jgi:hypothetical protein
MIESERLHFLIASDSYKRCIARYFAEHYQGIADWSPVEEVNGRTVYRITKDPDLDRFHRIRNRIPEGKFGGESGKETKRKPGGSAGKIKNTHF